MAKAKLPAWAKLDDRGRVHIDPAKAYPALAAEMRKAGVDVGEPIDGWWAGILRIMARFDVERALIGTEDDPRPARSLVILIKNRPAWRIADLPNAAAGADRIAVGKAARRYWARLRKMSPQHLQPSA